MEKPDVNLWRNGYAIYRESDGTVNVTIGLHATAPDVMEVRTIAAPAIWADDAERMLRVERAKAQIALRGLTISWLKKVRNPAFDKPEERTTTVIAVRPCRTQDEATDVLRQIMDYIRELKSGGVARIREAYDEAD